MLLIILPRPEMGRGICHIVVAELPIKAFIVVVVIVIIIAPKENL